MEADPQPPPQANPAPRARWPRVLIGLVLVLGVAAGAWFCLPAQERKRLEKKAEKTISTDVKKDKAELAHLENEVKTEAQKIEQDLQGDTHKFEAETAEEEAKLVHDLREDAANDSASLLSDSRRVLRDLSDDAPDAVGVETVGDFHSVLTNKVTPLQIGDFPPRPTPLLETANNPYFGNGAITPGFQSFTGAMWQPQFFLYGQYRNGVQTLDTGLGQHTAEWVNRLDLYANLNLTPTERFLVGVRPLDLQHAFSGYQFQPSSEPLDAVNGRITTLFFEGNFLSLFPSLDSYKDNWLGFDFTIGRQEVSYQDGILLNDYLDMVGFTRPSLFLLGSSASTTTFLYSWGNVHRADASEAMKAKDNQVFGWIMRSDYPTSTLEGDFFYTDDESSRGGDGVYGAISSIQRFGNINTSFRLLGSHALEDHPGPLTVHDGCLLFSQLSMDAPGTQNILYLNTFWGPGHFTSVSRSFDVGGPLASTGLLYASTQLGRFGAAVDPFPSDSVGGAIGYQMFLDEWSRQQLTFEFGGSTGTTHDPYQAGAAAIQYQQAFDQHLVWTIGGVAGLHNTGDTLWGVRTEISVSF